MEELIAKDAEFYAKNSKKKFFPVASASLLCDLCRYIIFYIGVYFTTTVTSRFFAIFSLTTPGISIL
jgi:hypothetical protein